MDIILASNSPRRRQLLGLTGLNFSVLAADIDETPLRAESASEYVQRLAVSKAGAVGRQVGRESMVIAADTTVVDGNQILGKPVDSLDAAHMLRQLRGRSHQVFTAIAAQQNGVWARDCCSTEVPMRNYSDEEVQVYVRSGDPLDKAGAYAIQHAGFHPVEGLQGCYANVVGLPLCHLVRMLRRLDLELTTDVPWTCQSTLGYECPVYEVILNTE
jgi:MAF protein